jgi:sterol-4alpha-carboxylate 3-dehydrogenase (decarboxylating)
MAPTQRDTYIVIGGSGFLGRHIVQALLDRGDSVSVLDLVQRHHDVQFFSADISDQVQVSQALQKVCMTCLVVGTESVTESVRQSGATCIIHTASPPHGVEDPALYWKVNVDGTKAIIAAAVANNVPKLVYTSSAGVSFNGEGLIDIDERHPYPEKPMDAYNESKAKAESIVLDANGKGGLYTVALRPSGIFGCMALLYIYRTALTSAYRPGDRQAVPALVTVLEEGRSHFQLGDNYNMFDWTYVDNVAYAHILAADKLVPPLPEDEEKKRRREILDYALPPVDHTTGRLRLPTSAARPLGPYVVRPENGDALLAAFNSKDRTSNRPVVRSRYDPLSDSSLDLAQSNPLQVAGQAFYITNGESIYFWDFPRALWRMVDPEKYPSRNNLVLPNSVGFALATLSEWWGWIIGKEPTFTRFRVTFSCVNRWHNIEKARRVLGYEPQVGLEEGMRRTVEVCTRFSRS